MSIRLTIDDLRHAVTDAVARQDAAELRGATETAVHDGNGAFDKHWRGVIGEMAWAALRGEPHLCDTRYTGKRPDAGGWEVRLRTRSDYELYVKDDDPDPTPIVLLLAHNLPMVCVGGVITAQRARLVGRRNPALGPHIYVAQNNLDPWSNAG